MKTYDYTVISILLYRSFKALIQFKLHYILALRLNRFSTGYHRMSNINVRLINLYKHRLFYIQDFIITTITLRSHKKGRGKVVNFV